MTCPFSLQLIQAAKARIRRMVADHATRTDLRQCHGDGGPHWSAGCAWPPLKVLESAGHEGEGRAAALEMKIRRRPGLRSMVREIGEGAPALWLVKLMNAAQEKK